MRRARWSAPFQFSLFRHFFLLFLHFYEIVFLRIRLARVPSLMCTMPHSGYRIFSLLRSERLSPCTYSFLNLQSEAGRNKKITSIRLSQDSLCSLSRLRFLQPSSRLLFYTYFSRVLSKPDT